MGLGFRVTGSRLKIYSSAFGLGTGAGAPKPPLGSGRASGLQELRGSLAFGSHHLAPASKTLNPKPLSPGPR